MISYRIGSKNPAGHYFDITLEIPQPASDGQILRLPAWIPGSYMIRDFAKNIVSLEAHQQDRPLTLTQLDKSSWQLPPVEGPVSVCYRVYAWDLSVRSAHLDTTHGFFNGTSVFLEVVGQADAPCEVEICAPDHENCVDWRIATTLPRKENEDPATVSFEFGYFRASNYDELIDHPVEMGRFTQFEFNAGGIRHDMVLSGRFDCDLARLKNDLVRICEHHINMFGTPAPMPRYLFLVMVVGEGYGGLEHRSSTSLLCSRNNLPQPGQSELTEEYRNFLGLCSHEYFHSWNVKRIRPAVFQQPDLSTEVYTPLLWAFEGITSYYDELALVRCGCITLQDYLELLGQTMTRIQRGLGRTRQSAADSSFNTWTKFYKQDENAANAIVSYYAKGSLIALCIDLKIRQLSHNQKSLDDVMRELWRRFQQGASGVEEHEIQSIVCELCGQDVSDFLQQLIYQVDELPLAQLLETVSLTLQYRASTGPKDKGGKVAEDIPASELGVLVKESTVGLSVVSVTEGSAAQRAGLSAGDELIALNDLRLTMASYLQWLKYSPSGSRHRLDVFRRDELMHFEVILDAPALTTVVLQVADENDPALKHWLHMS